MQVQRKPLIPFRDLRTGQTFLYKGKLFLKINCEKKAEGEEGEYWNAFYFEGNSLAEFEFNDMVRPVDYMIMEV
jgi:hypothetical protein